MELKLLCTEGSCPYCGKRLLFYNESMWKYGSPARICKKCEKKYIDRRYHEIAVEGIEPDTLYAKKNIIILLILTGIFLICFPIHMYEIFYQDYYHVGYPWLMVIIIIGIVIQIVDLVRIVTGLKAKKLEQLRRESENRLLDKNYARELSINGYCVPEKYL